MLLHNLPKSLAALSDEEVLDQLCQALREVGAATQFLSYVPPDHDVEDESQYVARMHAELRRRGINPAERVALLTSETGWMMAELLAECVAWPPERPWVRDAADGLRIAMRCRACEIVELPADARVVRLCDNCLDILDDAIATRQVRDNLLLYRTYNAEARCCEDAGDDTVLGVYPWSPERSGDNPVGLCRACVDAEKGATSRRARRPTSLQISSRSDRDLGTVLKSRASTTGHQGASVRSLADAAIESGDAFPLAPNSGRPYRWADMRRIGIAIVIIVGLARSGRSGAQPPDPEGIKKPHMVILMTSTDEAAARQAANHAADRLGYAVAPDTLRKPATRRVYVGAVITVQRSGGNGFEVVSYMGDQPDALEALAEGRKHYPDARIVPVELPKSATDEWIDAPFYRLGILVVGSYRSYDEALRAAKWFSSRSTYPYGSRGMVYDKERGLIWPDDSDDETWAGRYAPRRYDSECDIRASRPCITVERSEGYEGFTPGLYIVVGGVLGRDERRAERLAAARKIVPKAYVKQTTIYLGCTH